MLYSQRELQNILENYFKEIADTYGVEMAFLYGSWARGYPKESSDVDIAIVFSETDDEDEVFGKITDITLSLMGKIKLEINIIPVFLDFRKPILYYNAIVLGIPVFIRDQNRYAPHYSTKLYFRWKILVYLAHDGSWRLRRKIWWS